MEFLAFQEGGAPVSGRPGVRGVLDVSGLIREHHGVRSEIGAKDLLKQIRPLLLLQISKGVGKILQIPCSSCWPDSVRASCRSRLFCQEPITRMAMNIANQTPSQTIYGGKNLSFIQGS